MKIDVSIHEFLELLKLLEKKKCLNNEAKGDIFCNVKDVVTTGIKLEND